MHITHNIEKTPKFPVFLSTPFNLIPAKIHSHILVTFLNHLLTEQINEGDLDFLIDKRLCITVSDVNIKYYISLKDSRLISVTRGAKNNIEIKASIYDFLQLAARQQDPDTLVFQRRLLMQGNTELGLEIKNFLDGLDLESSKYFSLIERILKKSLPVYRQLFS